MYGYSVPPFSECYTRNEQYLTGVESPMYHSMTSNYAQVVHKFLKLIPQIMHLISSVVVQGVCIYQSTVLGVLYEAQIMSDRGGQPHRQQYDL